MESHDALALIDGKMKTEFEETKRVLTFTEYFDLFWNAPDIHARNAARYLVDTFEYYGRETLERPWGKETRFRLFDAPFDNGRDRLVGHERVQMELYRALLNFTREGRVKQLILLHGPNGSAKSTLISCIARALVDYSSQDRGALYSFRWVFPTEKVGKSRFGFGVKEEAPRDVESYAGLPDEQVDVRLGMDLRDHPLLLIPKERRQAIVKERLEALGLDRDFMPSDYVMHGDLSPRNREVFDALLMSYGGDYSRVLAHVQVERFFISRRYRRGTVTIEPQLQVDAGLRQLTADKSLQRLPPSLQSIPLFEPMGDLVDANRGMVEYNDLLKRPLESFKYLLSTSEKGTVSLPNCTLYLDIVFLGSSNEKHLAAFKQHPDFPSFKGRLHLAKVPYLRSFLVEKTIYDDQVTSEAIHKHIAPHTTLIAALWAVLTRMHRPDPKAYPERIRELVEALSPLDKARLFADGTMPTKLAHARRADLQHAIRTLYLETDSDPVYEGIVGASPREMKTILLNAAQNERYACLTPQAVFSELHQLVKDESVYEFLQIEPDGDYHAHERFIEDVRAVYLDLIDDEYRDAVGMVGARQYLELFTRYILHVNAALKHEKLLNPLTQQHEEADQRLMAEMEASFGEVADAKVFRSGLIGAIGAFRVANPESDVDYRAIFPELFDAMRVSYFERQKTTLIRFRDQVMEVFEGRGSKLAKADLEHVESCLTTLRERHGYCERCAEDSLRFLFAARYTDA